MRPMAEKQCAHAQWRGRAAPKPDESRVCSWVSGRAAQPRRPSTGLDAPLCELSNRFFL